MVLVLAGAGATLAQESGTLAGRVTDEEGRPVARATVRLAALQRSTVTARDGGFRLERLPPGRHETLVSAIGFAPHAEPVLVRGGEVTNLRIVLRPQPVTLSDVVVEGRAEPGSIRPGPDLSGALVLSGAKSEVLEVADMSANLAEKTPRQVFARVPGVFVYDMDGSGNQVNISTRGLDPHRSWELNVRQDGVLLNSDLYGYPASHYSPPMEAIQRVELVRGTAALQYGSQFGGLLNYATKAPDTTVALGVESINTVGSFGLLSTYDAVGGRVGPVDYYAYGSVRRSNGYREHGESKYSAQFLRATLHLQPALRLWGQIGRSEYLYQLPGPLTDAMFKADPRASTRSRNYFRPDIVIPGVGADWRPSRATHLTAQISAVKGTRSSVQFIGFANVPDLPDPVTDEYAPRQVDIDRFDSWTGEIRLTQAWRLGGRAALLATGVAVSLNDLHRQQRGRGTRGTDYDLAITPDGFDRDVHYRTDNVAAYVENLVRVTPAWSVIPGVRVEWGRTDMDGRLSYYDPANVPRSVSHRFPLFGVRTEYALPSGTELYGGWSQSYRPMILKDLLPESVLERTDPDIRDAKGWTLEAGLRGTLGRRAAYDLSGFVLRYDNRFGVVLRTDDTGSPYLFKTNVGSTITRGVEAALDVPVVTLPGFKLGAFTATSFFDATYRAGMVVANGQNQDLRGLRVEGVPRWISRSGLTGTGGRWSTTVLLSHVASSYADPLNTVAPTANAAAGLVPAYTLLDINGSADLTRWLRVHGGVSNVFDVQYFTKRPAFYPGPGVWPSDGRGVQVSAAVRF